jgi:hypothetical protein
MGIASMIYVKTKEVHIFTDHCHEKNTFIVVPHNPAKAFYKSLDLKHTRL